MDQNWRLLIPPNNNGHESRKCQLMILSIQGVILNLGIGNQMNLVKLF